MPSGPIRLHIADVLTAVPAQTGIEAGMVMLTEDNAPYRSLRIIIGQSEAIAIKSGWDGSVPSRPSTWDLFVSAVALLGGRFERVVITAVHQERHYFAHIELEQGGEHRILACRPSDAIALAVRGYNVEITAEASVLDAAGVLPDGTRPGKAPDVDPADALAEREAAFAAREAALEARERALHARELAAGADATQPARVDAEPPSLNSALAAVESGLDAVDSGLDAVETALAAAEPESVGSGAVAETGSVDPTTTALPASPPDQPEAT